MRRGHIRHGAVVFAISAAADRQAGFGRASPDEGQNKRQPEQYQQRDGQQAAHTAIMADWRSGAKAPGLVAGVVAVASLHVEVFLIRGEHDLVKAGIAALLVRRVAEDVLSAKLIGDG